MVLLGNGVEIGNSGSRDLRELEDNMKGKRWTILASLHPRKVVVMTVLVFVLLGIALHAARTQDQSESAAEATGVVTSAQNPLQIALLHWYAANLTAQFPAGASPYGVAFDGASIWVADNGSNKITKLRASDGLSLGVFPVGTNPIAVACDGVHVWVTNINSNNVTKLRASDGAVLGTFGVGRQPAGLLRVASGHFRRGAPAFWSCV